MRTFIAILLLLPFTASSFAPGGMSSTRLTSTTLPLGSASDGFNPPASPIRKQNFEGTGYDNGETWTEASTGGTPIIDEDYSTALVGLQSLRLQNADFEGCETRNSFTGVSEVYGFFRMKWVTKTDGTIFHQLRTLSSTILVDLSVNSGASATVHVANGAGSANTTATMTVGTEYYVWYHYLTGANATAEVWFSTSSTKPGDGTSGHAKTTVGTVTGDAAEIALKLENFSTTKNEAIFDRVWLAPGVIGNNP